MTEHAAAHPTPGDLFWAVPNFIIFVVVLVHFLRGPLREYFRARTTRLREGLEAGARARREASALRETLARDIAALPELRSRLVADMRAAAALERENLVGLGRRAAERILADARLLADHEVGAARQDLRAELIDEAVRQATALLRTATRPDDHQRFVSEFVGSAGRTP